MSSYYIDESKYFTSLRNLIYKKMKLKNVYISVDPKHGHIMNYFSFFTVYMMVIMYGKKKKNSSYQIVFPN